MWALSSGWGDVMMVTCGLWVFSNVRTGLGAGSEALVT